MDIAQLAKNGNGLVTARQALEAGLQYSRLSEAVSNGMLVRVDRGVYCTLDAWEDEYWVAQQRFSRGVFSDGTALFLHDFTDRTPERITMTFPRSYNATGARSQGIVVRTCSNEVLELGLVVVDTPAGNKVRAYDLERTLCDLVRGTASIDAQLVNPAMKAYVRSRSKNVPKLLGYAEKLGVLKKVRTYLEVLL